MTPASRPLRKSAAQGAEEAEGKIGAPVKVAGLELRKPLF
jgi:hypothetical protein